MHWFGGEIGEAIAQAKAKQTLFVVFVTDPKDEETTKTFLQTIESEEVSGEFSGYVCIKIEQGTNTFSQFSQLYPVLFLPSIFYIDSTSGMDVEVTARPEDKQAVLTGIARARSSCQQMTADAAAPAAATTAAAATSAATAAVAAVTAAATAAVASEGSQDLEAKLSRAKELLNENVGKTEGEVGSHSTPTSMEDRVERARRLMQQRKEQKEREEQDKEIAAGGNTVVSKEGQHSNGGQEPSGEAESGGVEKRLTWKEERAIRVKMVKKFAEDKLREERAKEKEKELERRSLGKNLLDMKQKQEEQKLKEAAMERRKDKEEERLAREKVKAAIEQDRVDRAAKFSAEKAAAEAARQEKVKQELVSRAAAAEQAAADRSTVSRIQFRLPDGRSQTNQFPADTNLGAVYQFVSTEVSCGFTSFGLSTSFPRRDLDTCNKEASLRELQLVPSATILILPKGGIMATQDGSFQSLLMLLLTPFTLIWGLIMSLLGGGGGGSAQAGTSGQSQSGGPTAGNRREGNLGRIRRDEDDENNTYNGNSTQQM